MRFSDLEGLTSLPVETIRHRFRNEQVLTVLPVRREIAARDSLLVATPHKLAVITGDVHPGSDQVMMQLAPWDAVRVGDIEPDPSSADGHRLPVHVDTLTFRAALSGPAGERALRDFIGTARGRQEALATTR